MFVFKLLLLILMLILVNIELIYLFFYVVMMGKWVDSLKGFGLLIDWELVESIGEGIYGEVYKVKNKMIGEIIVVKVIDFIYEKIEDVLLELEILMKYFIYLNIVGFYGVFINVDIKRYD